ncbi:MAG: proline racemase family protein [Crenarchaeota archaeon]|nr:proline racemase family protein [Thermoproteota archaeon]
MCCHAVIAVTTALIETGVIEPKEPYTFRYGTASGIVTAKAKVSEESVEEISVIDVPSFYLGNYELRIHNKIIPVHVAYGGNFFVIVESKDLGVELRIRNVDKLIRWGLMIRDEASRQISVDHPTQKNMDKKIKLVMMVGEPELTTSDGKTK